MEMNEFVAESPMHRVVFAINHYISTGDHLGEGICIQDEDDKFSFCVPVKPYLAQDLDDWSKLNSKLQDIMSPMFQLVYHGLTTNNLMMFTITVAEKDMTAFADALMEKPGKMGWGSMKPMMETLFYVNPISPNRT